MENLKKQAIKVIDTMPENAEIEDIMYRLYVIDKIHKGQSAIKNGSHISVEDLKQEIKKW